jgi:hypothetical protein
MDSKLPVLAGQPVLDVSRAPLPTPRTLSMRRSPLFQFTRFLAFNVRIVRMVLKGHKS